MHSDQKLTRLFLTLTFFFTLGLSGCGDGNTVFLVSLGDSLAVGVQPVGPNMEDVETNDGYVDQLFAKLKANNPNLELVKFGCPGETTVTMLEGGKCQYPSGTQLQEAIDFIKANQESIFLVTLNIGANDILACQTPTGVDLDCVMEILPEIGENLFSIGSFLLGAMGGLSQMIGMNYYNTLLAAWLLGPPEGPALAMASAELANALNELALGDVYDLLGVPVADVAGAFMINDFETMININVPPLGPMTVPINVGLLCEWTWMCTKQDIHANTTGYGVIADAFLEVVNDLGL